MDKTNFGNFLKKHWKKIVSVVASVLVISLLLTGCQGLVNANGTGNSVVVSKQEVI